MLIPQVLQIGRDDPRLQGGLRAHTQQRRAISREEVLFNLRGLTLNSDNLVDAMLSFIKPLIGSSGLGFEAMH